MAQLWTPPSRNASVSGRRIAQIIKLKPEFVNKYKDVHRAVWPEVLKEIQDCNIQDCRW